MTSFLPNDHIMTGTIFNIQRFSINDGPGIRTTVFLKGCPLRCRWCHNPESISEEKEIVLRGERCIRCGACLEVCMNRAVHWEGDSIVTEREHCVRCGKCIEVCRTEARSFAGREVTTEFILDEVLKDVVFYDQSGGGVTFSGGEPFLQHEFLISMLQGCKDRNIHTVVDTSGFTSPDILQRANDFIDLFLFDVKILDHKEHQKYTGVSPQLIHSNLRKLACWGKEIIVRVPLIPSLNDSMTAIRRIGEFVVSLKKIKEIHILPYHQTGIGKYHSLGKKYLFKEDHTINDETIEEIQRELLRYVPTVIIGG